MGKQKVQITKSDAEEDLELLLETESGKLSSTETQVCSVTTHDDTCCCMFHVVMKICFKASLAKSHTIEVDVTTQQKPAEDTKEDLEDWLDSILD